jgi:glycosyltransferase involved in cell wall biosynthesis
VSTPFLSIVIPAHNEEHRLPPSLQKIHEFLTSQPYTAEVLIIENGSVDRTLQIAQDFASQVDYVHVYHEEARGKGLAVRTGMLKAQGEYRFICDADLSMPIEQVNRFIPPALEAPDVAIGSREIQGAVRYHEPAYRHTIGRVFNTFVRWMALPGLHDTQCGFKCFRAQVAEEVFALQTLPGMSFDVEVLYIARKLGYRIQEVPIDWYFDADSRVKIFQDSLHMFLDLLEIRQNDRQGKYASSSLRSI